LEHLKYCWKWH